MGDPSPRLGEYFLIRFAIFVGCLFSISPFLFSCLLAASVVGWEMATTIFFAFGVLLLLFAAAVLHNLFNNLWEGRGCEENKTLDEYLIL